MPRRRIAPRFLAPALLALTGCGYVHLGRLPAPITRIVGDEQLVKENAELRLEKKMLQQELGIMTAQAEALRMAIENRAANREMSQELIARLKESATELAALRADYGRVKAERDKAVAAGADALALKARLGETEEKLAVSQRAHTELQDEVSRLRSAVEKSRDENSALTAQVKTMTTQNEEAQAVLAQLNTDLLAQKEARSRAEAAAENLRTELQTAASGESALARQRLGAAAEVTLLVRDHAPASGEMKHQIDLLRSKVEALESDRARLNAAAAALLAAGVAPQGAASAPSRTSVAPAPGRAPAEPPVVAEAKRIVLGTAGSPANQTTGSGEAGRVPGAANATTASAPADGRPAKGEAADPRMHVIVSGDTLAKISSAYYGTPARWGDILAANPEVMGEESKLVIGRVLRIP